MSGTGKVLTIRNFYRDDAKEYKYKRKDVEIPKHKRVNDVFL